MNTELEPAGELRIDCTAVEFQELRAELLKRLPASTVLDPDVPIEQIVIFQGDSETPMSTKTTLTSLLVIIVGFTLMLSIMASLIVGAIRIFNWIISGV